VRRFRLTIVWLAAGFVLAGAAFGFAQGVEGTHGGEVSAVAKPTAPPPSSGHGAAVSEVASNPARNGADENETAQNEPSGERQRNHGFYVSKAAHCEDVDDPDTAASPDFRAPDDCSSNGKAHGAYVSSVARSSLGKKGKGGEGDEREEREEEPAEGEGS
jgi:hypothetical protein